MFVLPDQTVPAVPAQGGGRHKTQRGRPLALGQADGSIKDRMTFVWLAVCVDEKDGRVARGGCRMRGSTVRCGSPSLGAPPPRALQQALRSGSRESESRV